MPLLTITWQISKIEPVGFSTQPSLAFSPSGQAAIAYYTSNYNEVRLATLNADGSWAIASVDSNLFGDAGPSLHYRFSQPAISYSSVTHEGGDTSKSIHELRYALFRGSSWTIAHIAPVRGTTSLAFDPSRRAGVGYLDFDAQKLRYAHAESPWTVWVSGDVDGDGSGDCALDFAASGQPAIAYSAKLAHPPVYGDNLIKYAAFNGSTWIRQDVANTRYGRCYALAFGPSGEPAICYQDDHESGYRNALVYAVRNGANWMRETIAQGADSGSLAFTPAGEPAVSYHDRQAEAIKYAVFSNRSWTHVTVEQAGKDSSGQFIGPFALTSLAFSPAGQPAISYYDRADGNLKYAIGTVSQTVIGVSRWWRDRMRRLINAG